MHSYIHVAKTTVIGLSPKTPPMSAMLTFYTTMHEIRITSNSKLRKNYFLQNFVFALNDMLLANDDELAKEVFKRSSRLKYVMV